MTAEEKKDANALLFCKFNEYFTQDDANEDAKIIEQFSKLYKTDIHSPLTMLFRGFIGGMSKGIELCNQLDKAD